MRQLVRGCHDSAADQLMLPDSVRHLRWFLLASEARTALLDRANPRTGLAESIKNLHDSVVDNVARLTLRNEPANEQINNTDSTNITLNNLEKSSSQQIAENLTDARTINTVVSQLGRSPPFAPVSYPLCSPQLQARPDHVWIQAPRLHYWPVADDSNGKFTNNAVDSIPNSTANNGKIVQSTCSLGKKNVRDNKKKAKSIEFVKNKSNIRNVDNETYVENNSALIVEQYYNHANGSSVEINVDTKTVESCAYSYEDAKTDSSVPPGKATDASVPPGNVDEVICSSMTCFLPRRDASLPQHSNGVSTVHSGGSLAAEGVGVVIGPAAKWHAPPKSLFTPMVEVRIAKQQVSISN